MPLGDRGHARAPDLRAVLAAGADFIVRVGSTASDAKLGRARLRLLGADGAPLARDPIFGSLTRGGVAERRVAVEHSGKGGKGRGRPLFEARLIVLRLPPDAAARAAKAVRRRRSRQCTRGPVQPLLLRSSSHPMLLTSLPGTVTAAGLLAARRRRGRRWNPRSDA